MERRETGPETVADLNYKRDLLVKLFAENPPFASLGYSSAQKEEATRAIRQLENEQGEICSPTFAVFISENGYYSARIEALQKTEGLRFTAHRNILLYLGDIAPEGATKEDIMLSRLRYEPRIKFFDDTFSEHMVQMSILPENFDYEKIDSLVQAIYLTENSSSGFDEVRKPNIFNKLRSRITKDDTAPTYRAAWLDSDTKLDLVVQYQNKLTRKYYKKLNKNSPSDDPIEVWRRLPLLELDGKSWMPFGHKVNMSAEQAMKAFEKPENVTVGRFSPAFNPNT